MLSKGQVSQRNGLIAGEKACQLAILSIRKAVFLCALSEKII